MWDRKVSFYLHKFTMTFFFLWPNGNTNVILCGHTIYNTIFAFIYAVDILHACDFVLLIAWRIPLKVLCRHNWIEPELRYRQKLVPTGNFSSSWKPIYGTIKTFIKINIRHTLVLLYPRLYSPNFEFLTNSIFRN